MTRHTETIEIITGDPGRRRWSSAEKAAKTNEPGMSVSLVARQEGLAASDELPSSVASGASGLRATRYSACSALPRCLPASGKKIRPRASLLMPLPHQCS